MEGNVKTFLRVLCFLMFPVQGLSDVTANSVPLIDALCTLLQETSQKSASNAVSWDQFSARLIEIRRTGKVSLLSHSENLGLALSDCKEKYGALADEGEFILEGKESTERAARKVSEPFDGGVVIVEQQLESQLGMRLAPDLEISVGVIRETLPVLGGVAQTSHASMHVRNRQAEYDQLWINFLESLKKKVLTSSL